MSHNNHLDNRRDLLKSRNKEISPIVEMMMC